ncbi:MAG: protein translocase subunit SecD [Ardenticatenales bacterium]|nr:protein translocase subunit SecD [Ardenticatenales bacterium]
MRLDEDALIRQQRNDIFWLILILALIGFGIWIALNDSYPLKQGLDLQGGVQVLMEADVPADQEIAPEDMDTVRQIINQRINGLGVAEAQVQIEGDRRILVELPGVSDTQTAVNLISDTALLEFIATGTQSLLPGTCVRTTENPDKPSRCELLRPISPNAPIYETVMMGSDLASSEVHSDILGQYQVAFEVKPEAAPTLEAFTSQHTGEFMTIVLDKQVISSPQIQAIISDAGVINGQFTLEEARTLALQLRYGSLPVPLVLASTRQVGATLGEASVQNSIEAGTIGLAVVLLFMLVYYRLPGGLADVALLVYALLNLAVFKWIGVTMTLPAITGFLLSTGMAVDANILVFERMKEELRHGRAIPESIAAGFDRAWTSIRDSNVATLVICLILWGFARNFGASTVEGFAITLAIGVLISMFTAVIVTRTLVRLIIGRGSSWLDKRRNLLGA